MRLAEERKLYSIMTDFDVVCDAGLEKIRENTGIGVQIEGRDGWCVYKKAANGEVRSSCSGMLELGASVGDSYAGPTLNGQMDILLGRLYSEFGR